MASTDMQGREIGAAAVFGSYLATCIGLTLLIASNLSQRIEPHLQRQTRNKQSQSLPLTSLKTFMMLAGICLSITWYYMISFFQLSYRTWALEHAATSFDLRSAAAWLKDVQLFRDAWEVALETPGRLIWSGPIFFITAAWSIYVCRSARLRAIPYAWAYMLLGQIVAISFAMNLFFLAVLLHDPIKLPARKPASSRSKSWVWNAAVYNLVAIMTIIPVALIPVSANGPRFMTILLLPHLALMLPPILAVFQKGPIDGEMQDRVLAKTAYVVLFGAAAVLQFRVIMSGLHDTSPYKHIHRHLRPDQKVPVSITSSVASATGWQSVLHSFRSHPAVSSVGFDVLLSSASAIIWFFQTCL